MYTKYFKEFKFYIVAKPAEYRVDYFIYDIEATDLDGTPLFQKKHSNVYPDPVDKVEDAKIFAHGNIKWDGCSNWDFDENNESMLHGCDKKDIVRLGLILGECWDWTRELIPNKWAL